MAWARDAGDICGYLSFQKYLQLYIYRAHHNKLVTLHPICQILRIPQNSLKIDFWIHNWTSKKICSKRYTQYGYILFWTPRKWLYLRPQNSTRSRPPKAADFFGSFFVFCTIISWESKIKYTHIEYISWNIFFSRSNYVFKNRCLMNFAEFWEFGRLGVGWPSSIRSYVKRQQVDRSEGFRPMLINFHKNIHFWP